AIPKRAFSAARPYIFRRRFARSARPGFPHACCRTFGGFFLRRFSFKSFGVRKRLVTIQVEHDFALLVLLINPIRDAFRGVSRNRILLTRAIEEAEGYTELGMIEHALRALQRRGALVHGNGKACFLLGEALRELSRYEEALLPLERSADLIPD